MRWLLLCLTLGTAGTVRAHHIFGLPHTGDRFNVRTETGPYELLVTGVPDAPRPGEHCLITIEIRQRKTGQNFPGRVTLTAYRKPLWSAPGVVFGPVAASPQQDVFEFLPQFTTTGEHLVRIEFRADGTLWNTELPLVVGTPGSPWWVVGSVGGSTLVFLVVIRALRHHRQITGRPEPGPVIG